MHPKHRGDSKVDEMLKEYNYFRVALWPEMNEEGRNKPLQKRTPIVVIVTTNNKPCPDTLRTAFRATKILG